MISFLQNRNICGTARGCGKTWGQSIKVTLTHNDDDSDKSVRIYFLQRHVNSAKNDRIKGGTDNFLFKYREFKMTVERMQDRQKEARALHLAKYTCKR